MHSTVVRELWDEIKRFIPPGDRADAADTVVAVLINNDEDGESIQEAFKGDREIKKALTAYVDSEKVYTYDDDEDEYDEDNDEW
jgi:hypothetical protein